MTDDSKFFFASTDLVFKSKNGKIHKGKIGIGTPCEEFAGQSFSCEVVLGDLEKARKIVGMDSLHAVIMGLSFLRKRLQSFRDDLGWEIFYSASGTELQECDPENIFPIEEHLALM